MAAKPKGKSKGGDDEEESMFMPLEEALRKLKAGPMNFGLYQTTDKDKPVLLAVHKRKNAEFLGKQAKKEAGTTKGAFGRLSLESSELLFQCETDKVPGGLKKRLRLLLKAEGFLKFKPRLLLPGGNEVGEEDEDDEEGEIIAPGGSATKTRRGGSGKAKSKEDKAGEETEDPKTAALRELVGEMADTIVPELETMAGGDDEKAADQAKKLLAMLRKADKAGDLEKLRGILKVADKLVHAGGVATAGKKAEKAEGEAEPLEDEMADQAGKVRGKLGGIRGEIGEVRGDLDDLNGELEEALKEAEALIARMETGETGKDWDRERDDLRKRALAMKKRLDATGKTVSKLEKQVGDAHEELKEYDKVWRVIDELGGKAAALRKAVEEAEAVEEEVDDAIDRDGGADGGGEGGLDPKKAAKLRALTEKRLKAGQS